MPISSYTRIPGNKTALEGQKKSTSQYNNISEPKPDLFKCIHINKTIIGYF